MVHRRVHQWVHIENHIEVYSLITFRAKDGAVLNFCVTSQWERSTKTILPELSGFLLGLKVFYHFRFQSPIVTLCRNILNSGHFSAKFYHRNHVVHKFHSMNLSNHWDFRACFQRSHWPQRLREGNCRTFAKDFTADVGCLMSCFATRRHALKPEKTASCCRSAKRAWAHWFLQVEEAPRCLIIALYSYVYIRLR